VEAICTPILKTFLHVTFAFPVQNLFHSGLIEVNLISNDRQAKQACSKQILYLMPS
jgi:hypothetical protein